MKIRWIHISDLHFKKDSDVETTLMHRRLPAYLTSLNLYCDYVFCTGDIKEYSETFTKEAANYILEIIQAVHVPLERLFLVPGNHDIDISAGGSYYEGENEYFRRDDVIGRLTDWHTDYYDPEVGTIEDSDMAILSAGKVGFIDFVKKIYSSNRAARYAPPTLRFRQNTLIFYT